MIIKLFFLFAIAHEGFFRQFPNRHFVETGSRDGGGIDQALRDGFEQVYSVEIADGFYEHCREKYVDCPSVHLWHGDSGELLEEMIASIDEPITFWLDGHWSGDPPTVQRGPTNTGLWKELEIIARHPIKTHTILIDDVRCFGTEAFDYLKLEDIIAKLYEINPNYDIRYRNGHTTRDILVARVFSRHFRP